MQVQIKYFASVREALGTSGELMQTQAATVGALRDELLARSDTFAQALARGRALRIALNHTMTQESAALTQGCEVAFFPPVTGG
jgi:sulfur-carrier protein